MFELYPLTIAAGIVLVAAITLYILRKPLARFLGQASRRVEQVHTETGDAYRKGMEEEEKI